MSEIRLTPLGHPRWDESAASPSAPPEIEPVRRAFDEDWRAGLFDLAAGKIDVSFSPTLGFWRSFGGGFLAALCHLPADARPEEADAPGEAEMAERVLTAPPMRGGEYLTPDTLADLWRGLTEWAAERARAAGGLGAFIEARAPLWRQVGRVCFHLAENKADPERPFAFMATYVPGLGVTGRARHQPLGQALTQYAGNRGALIRLLSPIQAAAERLPWVKALIDSGEVYHPRAWTPQAAHRFLAGAPALEESGLAVRMPDWWRKRARPVVSVVIGDKKKITLGLEDTLDFDVRVAMGDETLTEDEIREMLSGADGLIPLKGQWVEVDREKLREALKHWETVRRLAKNGEVTFIEGMRMLAGAPADMRGDAAAGPDPQWTRVETGAEMRRLLAELREPSGAVDPARDAGVRAEMRPYQSRGVEWLWTVTGLGLGACLADDMGLGKTLQVLALLSRMASKAGSAKGSAGDSGNGSANGSARRAAGPSLLVAPASLLGNWRAEAARFVPSLKLAFLHSSETERAELDRIAKNPKEELAGIDLALTTYSMVARQGWLTSVDWNLVILDEAQAIKNSGTSQARAVRGLRGRARIAMTGTPVENRLGDLWSLFDFLNPGLLGSAAVFKKFVGRMESGTDDRFAPLRRLVGPYILRRLKTDRTIITDLPDKTEVARHCHLTRAQAKLYEGVVESMKRALATVKGIERRALALQTLMRLKQVCNHPSQLTGDGEFDPKDSGKFRALAEICEELAERQERVLVFTQFREIIDPLAAHLASVFGRPGLTLHGGTQVGRRREIVEDFQREDGPPFFILSLKAGGSGLNLTAASHVVHFDRWWNPAVEDQATDRAFRIGQKKNVLAHKFVTRGSLEERIDLMIREKRALADQILTGGGEIDVTSLNDEELINLVRLDVSRATEE